MSPINYFAIQAYNNAWANHRLLKICGELSPFDLEEERQNFFPTIIETLNHILTVDWYYISALEGESIGFTAFEPEIPFKKLPKLMEAQKKADQRLITICREASSETLLSTVEIKRAKSSQFERFDRVLMHLLQHQIHHRGQIHAMLSGTSTRPPQLDEFYLDDPQERKDRAPELAAIGLSEELVWETM
ncbi:DinB family protein [Flexibacterium corallicola]|uniref:DinB family protein n=1 Tax=Flexibacterium corallicola TaxID=3037259 RepID=UPI00286EDD4A|nr:DinB family protein [Pseudovibrio sp. M1P-2-3]